jgi:hypothetical protein
MYPAVPPPPDHGTARPGPPWATLVVTAFLTLAAVVVGQRDWAVPRRVLGGWQVAAVPGSLTVLLLSGTALCLVVGAWAVRWDAGLRPGDLPFLAWAAVSLLAAAALIWNALVMAANAAFETGAIIPVFHWMFTFVPALLAGLVARGLGAERARAAALGTAVVTLPLFGLGWALFASRESAGPAIGDSLWTTVIFGVVPLGIAVAIAGSSARGPEHSLQRGVY